MSIFNKDDRVKVLVKKDMQGRKLPMEYFYFVEKNINTEDNIEGYIIAEKDSAPENQYYNPTYIVPLTALEKITPVKDWIETKTGKAFEILNPKEDQIDLEDVIHALARETRFGNHIEVNMTVLQHSLNCYYLANELNLSDNIRLYALTHDIPEAYLGDIVRPLKKLLPNFEEIEENILYTFYRKYGIDIPTKQEWNKVMQIDNFMLYQEGIRYTHNTFNWLRSYEPYGRLYPPNEKWFQIRDRDKISQEFAEVFNSLINKGGAPI